MTQAQEQSGHGTALEDIVLEQVKPQARERRRSSISLALPVGADQQGLAASVNIGANEVEFEAHGIKINHEGLFIQGTNVSEIHQDDLRVLSELGRGACSVVKKAQHVETRQLYAIKVFSVFDRDKRAQLLKEVETLWGMECPSLISFVGGYLKDGSIHVVLEYMDRGSLTDLIHGWRDLEYGEDLMAAVVFQILWGLGYLHYEHHVHRDVKPQNILLNSKGEVKLSDFGIARELEGAMDLAQTMVGTIRYMSPERLAGSGYGVAADVWSLGVVLLEMAARRLPFDTTVSQIELHDKLEQDLVVDDLINLVPGYSPHFEEVLRGCLQPRPEKRLSPMELLELEWFRRFRLLPDEEENDVTEAVAPAASAGPSFSVAPGGAGSDAVDNGDTAEEVVTTTSAGRAGADDGQEGTGAGTEAETSGGADAEENDREGEGSEQQDLDRAAQIVLEYVTKAVDCGLVAQAKARRSVSPGLSDLLGPDDPGDRRESTGSGMIQTMRSDGDLSDSDSNSEGQFRVDRDEDFGIFADLRREGQDALNGAG